MCKFCLTKSWLAPDIFSFACDYIQMVMQVLKVLIMRGTYIMAANIRSNYTRNTCIGNTYAISTRIACASVGDACTRGICARSTFVWSVEPRVLAGWGITLVGSGINDCYLQLFIGLIFVLMDGTSCWCRWESRSSKNSYTFNVGYIVLYLKRLFLSQIGSCSLITRLARCWFIRPLGLPM